MKKNVICALCFCLLLLTQAVSCGNEAAAPKQENPDGQESVGTETDAETEASDEKQIPDSLPETDLGGYNFRMLVFTKNNIDAVYAESETGAVVNDAVYAKIRAVEERFNCDISLAESSNAESEDTDIPRKAIMAGEDAFDIAMGHDISYASMSLDGLFCNLYDVPYLDFSKPWWPSRTVESLSLGEQMYLFSNFISYYSMSDTRVMFFNKQLLQNLDLESPYQLVYDHQWTLDRMNTMVQSGYADLNGDGKAGEEDQYGYLNPKFYYCFLECFLDDPYKDMGDGTLSYVFDVEKAQRTVDKLYDILFGGSAIIVENWDEATRLFSGGNILFTYGKLSHATNNYSDANITYGILPMPMLDENQKDYMAGCTDRPVCVPVTAESHLDQTGLIIEAMSAEGYRKVFPAYFEVALKTRYSDQSDDAAMIDIVMNNVVLSFTYMYGNQLSPFNTMLETLFKVSKPSKDVASYAAKNEKAQNKRVEKISEQFADMR